MRMGCVKAICTPAMRLASELFMAVPRTKPAKPADASKLMPRCLICGKVINMADKVTIEITTTMMRCNTFTCVCTRRAARLSATSSR